MEFRILGPVEIVHRGEEISLDGSKQRTVLAALLIAGDRMLPDAELTRYLWGDSPPATASAQIYTYVSRLRKILAQQVRIVRRTPGYLLQIGSCRFDLAMFEELARHGQAALLEGRYEESAATLREALALWRGAALVDVCEHLGEAEGPQLEEARIAALASRVDADMALGRHALLLPELTRLVRRYPMQERFRAQLMTVLYRCDRQADALVLYDQGRRMLADELGIDPGLLLRGVHQAILTEAPELWAPRSLMAMTRTGAPHGGVGAMAPLPANR